MAISKNVPLKKYSNYKIGGPASYFCEFSSKDELVLALEEYKHIEPDGKIFILGSGTNILFNDNGFEGLVLKNNIKFIKREGDLIEIGSGNSMDELVSFALSKSLSGIEWAGGLPGTIGGAIRGNAGAFLGESKDNLVEVESFDEVSLKTRNRSRKECGFDYRQSIFKNGVGKSEIILSAKFSFKKGIQAEIKKSTQEKIDYRIDRHPLDIPNIGSIFKNVPVENAPKNVVKEFEKSVKPDPFPVIPVAKLIIGAHLMGKVIGGATISTKHPNFIVNNNNAKASDVLFLINLVKTEIKAKYGISLEEEIMVV